MRVISRPPWELACSKSNMADELVLFNVQHKEQGVVTQKICNILTFARAKRQGETCICYFMRKGIHLQVLWGETDRKATNTTADIETRVVTTEENSLSRNKPF